MTTNINPNTGTSESQCKLIKDWLLAGNKITPIEALNMFGSLRLSGRIHELRQRGLNIITENYITTTGKRVARYYIDGLCND